MSFKLSHSYQSYHESILFLYCTGTVENIVASCTSCEGDAVQYQISRLLNYNRDPSGVCNACFFRKVRILAAEYLFLKLDLQSEEGEIDCAKLLSISLRHCLRLQDRSALSSQDGSLLNRALSIGIEALGEKRYQIASLGGQYHTMTITLSHHCIFGRPIPHYDYHTIKRLHLLHCNGRLILWDLK